LSPKLPFLVLDGCPMFAPAYMGRKRWAQPNDRFCFTATKPIDNVRCVEFRAAQKNPKSLLSHGESDSLGDPEFCVNDNEREAESEAI
jgi:hypothetical protein